MARPRALPTALAVLAASLLGSCGGGGGSHAGGGPVATGPGAGKPRITLGTKNFPEQFILGQLYKQALEAKGFKVDLKNDIGSTEVIDEALTSGHIDLYPEYTGTIVQEVEKASRLPMSAAATYARAKAFEGRRGLALLEPAPFFDRDAIAVTAAYAKRNRLASTGDLRRLGAIKYGAPPENRTRLQGLVGLRRLYGLTKLRFVPLTIGLQYQALDDGKIQAGDVFTTDGQLQGGRYMVLSDPRRLFGFQNAVPVVRKTLLAREGPAFAATMNAVSAKLTLAAIRKLNAAVVLGKKEPAAVAAQFLSANGLK